jgi:hypothetical protein
VSTPEEQVEHERRATEVEPEPVGERSASASAASETDTYDNAERRRRRERKPKAGSTPRKKPPAATAAPAVDASELAEVLERTVRATIQGQKELAQWAESLVRDQLLEERARRKEAEAKLASAEARLAELEANRTGVVEAAWKTPRPEARADPPARTSKRRRWWQR